MKYYQAAVKRHLGQYARFRLGVFEEGTFKGRSYAHILPARLRFLNFLESYRAELQDYCSTHRAVKLHQYFHHLNSSQAFAFNLFFPYFSSPGHPPRALSAALGINASVLDWEFEHVADKEEGTNVDVVWRSSDTASTYCEIKLTESDFGTAKDDERHRRKLLKYYRPRLEPLVSAALLREKSFFKNYQLLRNICMLAGNSEHRLVILLPRENELLDRPLREVLDGVEPRVRERINVRHVEDCLRTLQEDASLSPKLRLHASSLEEKYLVSSSGEPVSRT